MDPDVDIARLLLELGGVLFALGVLARLAHRVGFSPIPFYLLAGLAFGKGGFYPLVTAERFIHIGAEIGVVLLLLVLGLEYSADELVTSLRRQSSTGAVDLALNAAPGAIAALLLGWGPLAALALAGITAVSSSGIVAKVLDDLGWLGNRETPTVLTVLVLEDLAMALYLPVLTALLASAGLAAGSATIGLALGTLSVVLVIALRYGVHVSRVVAGPSNEVLLLQVLGFAMVVAGAAATLQVSAAVGAFLVGIALSGRVAEGAREVLTPLRDLFAAVFFVFFGLSTDPAALPAALPVAGALAAVGVVTKLGSGWYAGRRAGVSAAGRLRAGAVLVPRGEFSIVIATLATAAGVTARLGPLTAAYVVLLAAIGPVLPRLADPLARRFGNGASPPGGGAATATAPDVPARAAARPG